MPRRDTTRRDFLRTTVLSSAAVGVPMFVSSRLVRADGPTERLNLATIGVGGRGTSIGRTFRRFGNIVACADVKLDNAKHFAKSYGHDCKVYEDYRRVLDRKDVAAITCGTPDHWHTKIAIDAMEAGKHVYCEKPLTLTIEESRQITEAAKRTGRVFQVGTQQRSDYGGKFLGAVAIARSGRLGNKLHAISSVGGAQAGGPFDTQAPPKDLNWDFWLGQAPKLDYCPNRHGGSFRWWLEYSGGQVTDWGVHHTDIAIWALGGEETGIVEAEGEGHFPGWPDSFTTDDLLALLNGEKSIPNTYNVARSFDVKMRLPNGNTINLLSKKNELIIEGEKGRIRVNRGGLTGKPVEEIQSSQKDRQWLDEEVKKLYRGMPLNGHMANFFHCIETGEMPISDVWSHCHSVNACHIANIAMFTGRKLKFDPKTMRFIDDDEANRFVSRRQRAPYQIG